MWHLIIQTTSFTQESPIQVVQKKAFGMTLRSAETVGSRLNYGKLIGRTVHNIKTVSDTVQNGN